MFWGMTRNTTMTGLITPQPAEKRHLMVRTRLADSKNCFRRRKMWCRNSNKNRIAARARDEKKTPWLCSTLPIPFFPCDIRQNHAKDSIIHIRNNFWDIPQHNNAIKQSEPSLLRSTGGVFQTFTLSFLLASGDRFHLVGGRSTARPRQKFVDFQSFRRERGRPRPGGKLYYSNP